MANVSINSFNGGEMTPKAYRDDIEKYASSCKHLENFIPLIYGCAERRPGTKLVKDATTAPNGQTSTTKRMIPFIYSTSVAYSIEVGTKYMRFYFGDAVLTDAASAEVWISTPYLEDHIFDLQFKQIGDVMRITHKSYAPRFLQRTDVYTFELTEIDFRKGPFLTRNDLVDPDNPSDATVSCDVTAVGAVGILTSSNDIFLAGHAGALFQLVHSKTTTEVSQSGSGTSDTILIGVGGGYFITQGTWVGTIILQRKEPSGEWEDHRTYTAISSGARNDKYTIKGEDQEGVLYRIKTNNATCKATLTSWDSVTNGVVKVQAVLNAFQVSVEVYATIESTDSTLRWAEGAWSETRGYPSTISFFEDRIVYSGASKSLTDDEFSSSTYPALRL